MHFTTEHLISILRDDVSDNELFLFMSTFFLELT